MRKQRSAWNKGRLLGQKPLKRPKEIWSLRIRLQLADAQGALHRCVARRRDRLGGRIPVHARAMNFHELLQTVLAEVDAAYPNRIECSLEAANASGEWDPDRLAQVVENLVVNAMKYGVEGGTVRLRTSADEGSLEFEVHNDGAPIAEDKIASMFEPLQRGADASQPNPNRSIGMGLFIVKHIVEAHGGRIRVDSTLERGTTFTVSLPRVR